MKLQFTKMHGCGNDFVVLDATKTPIDLSRAQAQRLADRRLGIGCDQILIVEAARDASTEFYYRILNADGGEVEQCGNGARCFARFVAEKGLTTNNPVAVGTAAGPISLRLEADDRVRVDMGAPILAPDRIPFVAESQAPLYTLEVNLRELELAAVSMGNPHAIWRVDDADTAAVDILGPNIENHPRFPQRVNVGFLEVTGRDTAKLRVWERGVGETQACGTGACAAVVAGIVNGWFDSQVQVQLSGGTLNISWAGGTDDSVIMTGPATTVFEGEIVI